MAFSKVIIVYIQDNPKHVAKIYKVKMQSFNAKADASRN
jgi:hypothetical protein